MTDTDNYDGVEEGEDEETATETFYSSPGNETDSKAEMTTDYYTTEYTTDETAAEDNVPAEGGKPQEPDKAQEVAEPEEGIAEGAPPPEEGKPTAEEEEAAAEEEDVLPQDFLLELLEEPPAPVFKITEPLPRPQKPVSEQLAEVTNSKGVR